MLLSSLRFHLVGSFELTSAVVAGIRTESNLAPQAVVEKRSMIKHNPQTHLCSFSKTPHCFSAEA